MALRSSDGSSCLNCRTRKVRCDRVLPQCSQCKQRSLECLVPEPPPRLLWLPIRTLGDFSLEQEQFELDVHVRRKPLFKRGQQARNADDLLSLMSDSSLGAILEQLDYQADKIPSGMTASNGPFHAFRHEQPTLASAVSPMLGTELPDLELWRLLSDNLGNVLNEEDITLPWLPNLCLPDGPIVASEIIDEANSSYQVPQEQQSSTEPPASGALLTTGPSVTSPADLKDFTMSTAKLLLDHYRNIITTLYTPAPTESKTPWEILYVPNVLNTLGEIALTGNSSDAKVSLLFAVFAISAFRLDTFCSPCYQPGVQDWNTLGNMYRQRATKRLQMALRHLSTGLPKKEKYKNILMPLLSMVTICAVSGEMKNAAHYLSDIEQIITLYGINKVQKSRKVKMLHSIYVYLRVLSEGTHMHNQSLTIGSSEILPQDADRCSSLKPTTWDILLGELFDTYDMFNLDFMQYLAPPKSTFEQIYSIPDSLFRLILETTQLAREVERLRPRRQKTTDHDIFAEKVREHENKICEWDYYYKETTYPGDPVGTPPLKERFPYHLTQAIYAALIIYFYRSIRDVNVIALQPYVQQTIYHLSEYDKHKERHQDRSSDICWPAFIAGCEATTPESRQQISEWLEKSTRSNGILMFRVALKAIQKVWAARTFPGKQNLSWSTVLSESNDMRVLVLS
ncbi:fungal-specific transcription factor domain-containing protein [Aspergillus aurantiobrunneus]